jgi:hypothetical protein
VAAQVQGYRTPIASQVLQLRKPVAAIACQGMHKQHAPTVFAPIIDMQNWVGIEKQSGHLCQVSFPDE